ncbi:6-phospho-3-hexuloisomerase, partial [Candidatus Woesebacteria bacterium]|nr:6-phospho-3-hexuloisomerase [Candidatus Woesebacteria bacterium]
MSNDYFQRTNTVLKEIETVLYTVEPKEIQALIKSIRKAHTIVVAGAGRVGMATRAFAMRLG